MFLGATNASINYLWRCYFKNYEQESPPCPSKTAK
jgi:hypothetical protein